MYTSIRQEPIYHFQITPRLALQWSGLSLILILMTLIGVAAFYEAIHGESWGIFPPNMHTQVGQILLAIAGIVGIPFGTIVMHELVHGIAFAAFGGSPRYGMKFTYLLPIAYATAPGDRFSRNDFVVIGLAPLVMIDLIGLMILAIAPHFAWVGWVVVLNTAGAIGDIWIVALLLRSPPSIQIEDREDGIAIYAPKTIGRQDLPFAYSRRATSPFQVWLNTTLLALIGLLVAMLLLPILLSLLNVPTFTLGTEGLSLFRWQQSDTGFGFSFNPLLLLSIAAGIGIIALGVRSLAHNRHHF